MASPAVPEQLRDRSRRCLPSLFACGYPPTIQIVANKNRVSRRLEEAHKLIAELRARIDDLTRTAKTPDNSSLPPSKRQKPNSPNKGGRPGPRQGSLGRKGDERALTAEPDEVVVTRPARCQHCHAAFTGTDHTAREPLR